MQNILLQTRSIRITRFQICQISQAKPQKDRAFNVGYFTQISENLSVGAEDEVASIDGLMSAIYHRFGF